MAGLAFDSLKRNSGIMNERFDADAVDRQTVRMAALLHDVGHTPFSHSLEEILGTKHENYSKALIDHYFAPLIEKAEVKVDNIKNLISGEPYPGKPFLSRIVNGQLDVDRLDYLLRDSYYAGVTYGKFDLSRIIDQLCVVDGRFVVLQGGYEVVEQMVLARYHMYQQLYFHKTKRAFELMLWKCADMLKQKGLLDFPSLDELKQEAGRQRYAQCDDLWFLSTIYKDDNSAEVKTIAKMIRERIPYLETYSPLAHKTKSKAVKQVPADSGSAERLEPIQTHLLKELPRLGIEEYEFLTDDSSRAPYELMPNYAISDDADAEGSAIQICYKNNKFIEPIEKRSKLIHTLAVNQPLMIRGFVIPGKYNVIRKFLQDTYDYSIPER